MLNKQALNEIKVSNLSEIYRLIEHGDSKTLLFILKNLGHLPAGFDGDVLLPLLKSRNSQIQFWVIKNLGKLGDFKYMECFFAVATGDFDSTVRREAVSAIGRLRDERAVDHLLTLLKNEDPKIVLQAVRGLLVFKKRKEIADALKGLKDHPNEIIQSVINKEFFPSKSNFNTARLSSNSYIKNLVVNGDVEEVLPLIDEEVVDLTFTSPPYYNARDYSIYASYQDYLDFLSRVFKEVHRVTKEGRFFILNTSPVIVPRVSRAHSSTRYAIPFDIHPRLTEMGWEFIDDIIWAKPEASVKNRNGGFMQHRKPLGYKPNLVTEYLMVYRKKTDKLIDWNMHQYDKRTIDESKVNEGYATTNLWEIDPVSDKVHSAVFPQELCRRVISLYSYVGDIVLDPFAGSGTVGRVATALNRSFFLVEKDKIYFDRIRESLDNNLFQKSQLITVDALRQMIQD